MFKNFPWCVAKEFLCSITFAFILFVLSLVVLVSSSYAQESPLPTCSTTQWTTCIAPSNNPQNLNNQCLSNYPGGFFSTGSGCSAINGNPNDIKLTCQSNCSCPSGYIMNTTINGGNYHSECVEDTGGEQPECAAGQAIHPTSGTCAPSYDDPFECAGGVAGGTAIQNSTGGYSCEVGDNYPCPSGTTPGTAFDGNGNSINTCTADSGNSSSHTNSSSQNSSTGSGDDGSGGGSSSGNETGNSSSASSNGSGGNGSSSSGHVGSASSAGAGQCDPTAKNYLECLNSKELDIPSEKGSYDGIGGTSTEDRIGELEGELQGVVDQIKSEINDTVGVSLSGGGTLTDQCYQIMKVQVCFGWARWSQHLSLISSAILAMAYIASFIIIMRQ